MLLNGGDKQLDDALFTEQGVNLGAWTPRQTIDIRFRAIAQCDKYMFMRISHDLWTVAKNNDGTYTLSLEVIVIPRPIPIISRGQFAKNLAQRLLAGFALPPSEGAHFIDTAGFPHADWIGGMGWMSGHGNGRFGPTEFLTREQLAIILCKWAMITPNPDVPTDVTMANNVSAWAKPSVIAISAFLDEIGYQPPMGESSSLNFFGNNPKSGVSWSIVDEMLDAIENSWLPIAATGN